MKIQVYPQILGATNPTILEAIQKYLGHEDIQVYQAQSAEYVQNVQIVCHELGLLFHCQKKQQ